LLGNGSHIQAQTAKWGNDIGFSLPDPSVTPGAVNQGCVADPSRDPLVVNGIEVNMCARDFRTRFLRHTLLSTKKLVCSEYGAANCPSRDWEVDHLISLELCGLDSKENLWPQPIAEARVKDHLVEDVLPKLICSGKISLEDAQKCIASDWVKCVKTITDIESK
jgi:hypothetical protein